MIGVSADDGQLLWGYNKIANGTANIPTPIVRRLRLLLDRLRHGGAALLQMTKRAPAARPIEIYFLRPYECRTTTAA